MAVTEAQPKEDSFLISIYYERWTHDDKDAGEPGERGLRSSGRRWTPMIWSGMAATTACPSLPRATPE
ncbi:hypothetical protein C0073_022755 (plasmid) [Aeromonas veronii]|nr:hypothetical protein C0073_022045 [Aeromonas veronii]AYK20522.1 hypothetical protein C0073_022755 [Aeromonas veronii]